MTNNRQILKYIGRLSVFMVVLLWGVTAAAQSGGFGSVDASNTSFHKFVKPGESTIDVLVLGAVRSPGVYRVGEGTDLSQLIALIGGNGLGPRSKNELREISIDLLRRSGDSREIVYEAGWEEMLQNPGRYPVLEDGDLLQVEAVVYQEGEFTWRDGMQIITSAVSLAWAIDRVARIW